MFLCISFWIIHEKNYILHVGILQSTPICYYVLVCPFKLSSGELVTGGLLNIETELRDKIYILGEQSANSKDFTDHALISFIKLANKPILNGVVEIVWNRVVLHGISNIVQRSNTLLNVNQSRDFNF